MTATKRFQNEVTGDTIALVLICMGSQSDWRTMRKAAEVLDELEISFRVRILSAHRTPERLHKVATNAGNLYRVVIAGAGGAAHLAGTFAALSSLSVIGVPIQSKALSGMDSLLSTVQMPKGIPVGTMAIGESGAANAALYAASMLGINYPQIEARYKEYRAAQTAAVAENPQDEG